MDFKDKVLAVVGPTGAGKTSLAVELAQKFNGVILSADSRQVYRGLDIGTNKAGEPGKWHGYPARSVNGIWQLLIDCVDPGETFTLAEWLETASQLLTKIWADRQLPIVVGGTGLYVTALLDGYQPGEGRYATARKSVTFDSLILAPGYTREAVNKKSDERCSRIFDELLDETERLLRQGVSHEWLEKIGLDYRYASYYRRGAMTRAAAISELQRASRQYIRRQLTWWRHHGSVVTVKDVATATQVVKGWLDR